MDYASNGRAFRLRRRPVSDDGPQFELVTEPTPTVQDGEALVRTEYVSIDPASRFVTAEIRSDLPPVAVGSVMWGHGIGRIVSSRRADLPKGARVAGPVGWQDQSVIDDDLAAEFTVLPDPLPAAPEALLSVLGLPGISAWLAVEIADPRPGETVVVSAASGAVGSVAGQLARERGARVVGIAGGVEKTRRLVEDLGFSAAVDRHDPDWRERLDAATPEGVDAAVEAAGGEYLDHVLTRITRGARIALIGMLADYHTDPALRFGVRNLIEVAEQRATVQGMLVVDHLDRFDEITAELSLRVADRRLRYAVDVVDGLENAPAALARIFTGGATGKVIVRVAT